MALLPRGDMTEGVSKFKFLLSVNSSGVLNN